MITGRLARRIVEKIIEENPVEENEVHVYEAPIDVAALINYKLLDEILPIVLSKFDRVDYIIVPGYVADDLQPLSLKYGVKVVKGVKNARDIPLMIEALRNGFKPSPQIPFDEVMNNYVQARDLRTLEDLKSRAKNNYYFEIRGKPISPHYPTILAECLVKKREVGEVLIEINRFVKEGADIVVFGMVEHCDLSILRELLNYVKKQLKTPVGVDTSDEDLLERLLNDVDIVLNIRPDELERYKGHSNLAFVVIPRNLSSIEELTSVAVESEKYGFNKIILDPVLHPPMMGLSESIRRYQLIRSVVKEKPLLMGVGNVTELLDADSTGVLALLASIGVEIGVEAYLTVEASVKTRRSIYELRKALDLAVLAKETRSYPKDFSVNLLVAKSKRDDEYYSKTPREKRVKASTRMELTVDQAGLFRISVDRLNEAIVVEHYEYGSTTPDFVVEGRDPFAVAYEIFRRNLVSRIDHAFYLGYELAKAYKALTTGGGYTQDQIY